MSDTGQTENEIEEVNQESQQFFPPAVVIQNKIHSIVLRKNSGISKGDRDAIMSLLADLMVLTARQDTQIAVLQSKVDSFQELNETVLDPIIESNSKRNRASSRSYANIVKRGSDRQYSSASQNREYIAIVRPTVEGIDSDKTKSDLIHGLDPASLRIGIKRITNINYGGVLIQTETAEDLEKLNDEMHSKGLTERYNIGPPKLKPPTIIVFGVDEEVDEQDLVEGLTKQNIELEEGDVRVKTSHRPRNGKKNWLLEIKPETFNKLRYRDRLNLKWKRYRFEESLRVRQCYRCAAIGHLAKFCKSKKICRNCSSDDHTGNSCEVDACCLHCDNANRKFGLDTDINHSPFDRACAQYVRAHESKRTDYGY